MNIFKFFNLEKNPFEENLNSENILIDGRFQSVLESLSILPDIGTMASLTGRTGIGKTTLLRHLIDTWKVVNDVYYLHLGNLKSVGLMRAILSALGEHPRLGKDRMFEQFYAHLARKQRNLCLIIDESQLMDVHSMKDLRILCSHFDLSKRLILVLSGQPELNNLLNLEMLTDLRERMNVRVHLSSMSLPESIAYIEHRFKTAGAKTPIFNEASIKLIHHHAEGVPRRINNIIIKSMMNAWISKQKKINEKIVRSACTADRS